MTAANVDTWVDDPVLLPSCAAMKGYLHSSEWVILQRSGAVRNANTVHFV